VHFTREPIVESVLSARDGYKLVLKNSKLSSSTEISAEVIEIVSFTGTLFYRSQDRSKNFLLPASDFEVSEVKDARLVLKNISLEKSNKLQNLQRETVALEPGFDEDDAKSDEAAISADSEGANQQAPESKSNRLERRRERRRNRRRRHSEERQTEDKKEGSASEVITQEETVEKVISDEGTPVVAVPTLNLIPPPTTLISQTLARYKEKPQEIEPSPTIIVEENFEKQSFEPPLEPEDLV
jgi:hypothetical protein